MSTEPDRDVTPALGAALAEPDGSILDSAYAETCRAERAEAEFITASAELTTVAAEATAAERERITQVAEALGAHYHEGYSGQSAMFADYLRGQTATATTATQ